MPPWAAAAPRCTTQVKRTVIERAARLRRASVAARYVRYASTHVAPSAIHLRPNLPPQNRELHNALSALGGAAATWINTSRLQLALSGLGVTNGVTRVAVLGLGSQGSAQQLARLLVADPLAIEAKWETVLSTADADAGAGAVLLKYGEEEDVYPPTPLYRVLAVPSRVLRLHNLEILVTTLHGRVAQHASTASTESAANAILVPKLQATSARGTPVPYPVHKTLLLADCLDDAVAFGGFSAGSAEQLSNDTVKLAIHIPAPAGTIMHGAHEGSTAVNLQVGTTALAMFRESTQNAIAYERGWFRSGLPVLSHWLIQGLQPSDTINPAMRALIASIADDVEAKLTQEDRALRQRQASTPTQSAIASSILSHLSSWAETSHTELRDHLDAAFGSSNWHKLAWYKLLWRVDDVTMLSTEILERRWLVSAEKSSIFLAGRMDQAGFPDDVRHVATKATSQDLASTQDSPNSDLSMSTEVRRPEKWVDHIATARAELIHDAVPRLQALAQRLLLQTLSTTAMSSVLTAVLYLGVESFSLFEASAAAAVGLVFSLRRIQRLWEGAREHWEATVREEGRRVLKETEDVVRLIVQKTDSRGKNHCDDRDAKLEREKAREAIRRVREALDRNGDAKGKGNV